MQLISKEKKTKEWLSPTLRFTKDNILLNDLELIPNEKEN